MCDSCIDGRCSIPADLIFFKKSIQKLRSRTDLRSDHVDLSKAFIAYMMIDTDGLSCALISGDRYSYPVLLTGIQDQKQVVLFTLIIFCLDLIQIFDKRESCFRFFQINIGLNLRIVFFQIKIQAHACPYAVSIGTYMSCDAHSFNTF